MYLFIYQIFRLTYTDILNINACIYNKRPTESLWTERSVFFRNYMYHDLKDKKEHVAPLLLKRKSSVTLDYYAVWRSALLFAIFWEIAGYELNIREMSQKAIVCSRFITLTFTPFTYFLMEFSCDADPENL